MKLPILLALTSTALLQIPTEASSTEASQTSSSQSTPSFETLKEAYKTKMDKAREASYILFNNATSATKEGNSTALEKQSRIEAMKQKFSSDIQILFPENLFATKEFQDIEQTQKNGASAKTLNEQLHTIASTKIRKILQGLLDVAVKENASPTEQKSIFPSPQNSSSNTNETR
jgi:hypothetical protein